MPLAKGVDRAVALKYNEELPAPFILAKGKGELAGRIRRLAAECGVSLVEDAELVDGLIELEIGSLIPEDYYQIIAEILVFVRDRKQAGERGRT